MSHWQAIFEVMKLPHFVTFQTIVTGFCCLAQELKLIFLLGDLRLIASADNVEICLYLNKVVDPGDNYHIIKTVPMLT